MKTVTFPDGPIKMAGNLLLPKDFSRDRSYVAFVCVHPAGGVKEQTAGLYGAKLADEGMVALAYDASYQGESGGEPRQEEDPYARVEDIRAAVDYLTTLGFVDSGIAREMRHVWNRGVCRNPIHPRVRSFWHVSRNWIRRPDNEQARYHFS